MRRLLSALNLVVGVLLAQSCATQSAVRFKAVYLDMDGTVLDSKAEVRPRTSEALERYRACGGKVGLASGRTYDQLAKYVPTLKPDLPVVVFNGAASVSPDGTSVIYVKRLPSDAVAKVLAACRDLDGVIGVVVHDISETTIDRSTEEFSKILGDANITPTATLGEGDPAPAFAAKLLVLPRPPATEAVAVALTTAVGESALVVVSSPRSIEVVAPGVDKSIPIKAALETAGISPADTLLFGDSGNDIAMLSAVGPGFAMANCRKETCDAALAIIKGNDTDTIADVIEKIAISPACEAAR